MKTRAPQPAAGTNGTSIGKEGISKLSSPLINSREMLAMRPQKVTSPQEKFYDDLLSINDLGPVGIQHILALTARVKANPGAYKAALAGKQLALFFEKPSLRTRLTFEAGINS